MRRTQTVCLATLVAVGIFLPGCYIQDEWVERGDVVGEKLIGVKASEEASVVPVTDGSEAREAGKRGLILFRFEGQLIGKLEERCEEIRCVQHYKWYLEHVELPLGLVGFGIYPVVALMRGIDDEQYLAELSVAINPFWNMSSWRKKRRGLGSGVVERSKTGRVVAGDTTESKVRFSKATYLVRFSFNTAEDYELARYGDLLAFPVSRIPGLLRHTLDRDGPGELRCVIRYKNEKCWEGNIRLDKEVVLSALLGPAVCDEIPVSKANSLIQLPEGPVDLSTGESSAAPLPKVETQFLGQYPERAGVLRVQIVVRNAGKGALYCLIGHTSSPVEPLNNHIIVFGKVGPQEKVSRTLELPASQVAGGDPTNLTVRFKELNGYAPREVALRIDPSSLRRPRLACGYEIVDDPDQSRKAAGNADGVIQKGEAFDLVVRVKDTGEEPAKDARVRISLPHSPSLSLFTDSELSLGDIEPGGLRTCRFNVSVKPQSDLANLDATLQLAESSFGIQKQKSVTLPFETRVAPEPYGIDRDFYAGAGQTALYAGASEDADRLGSVSRGMLLHGVAGLKDTWVQVELPERAREKAGVMRAWAKMDQLSTEPPAGGSGGRITIRRFGAPPSVVFAEPGDGFSTRRGTVTVTATVSDDRGLARVIVSTGRQGQTEEVVSAEPGKKEYVVNRQVELLPGRNAIEVLAVDEDGQRTRRQVLVTRSEELDRKSYVLSVGIEDYLFMGDVPGCRADARTVAETLQEIRNIAPSNVTVMTGSAAGTRTPSTGVLKTRVRQLAREVGPGGIAFFYFSGHGVMNDDKLTLIPRDGSEESGVALEWVLSQLKQSEAAQKVAVIDTCRATAEKGVMGVVPDLRVPADTAVFFSCSRDEKSYPLESGEQSVYTSFFLQSLSELAGREDARPTTRRLQSLVEDKMRAWRSRTGKRQTPKLIAPGTPIPLLPRQ